MIFSHRWFHLVVFATVVLISTSCRQAPIATVEGTVGNITQIDDHSINRVVYQYSGYSVVIFHNEKVRESRDMQKRISYFADKYWKKIRFCEFRWDVKQNGKKYNLQMLPTVVLYFNGQEIDRIKGIPKGAADRKNWNNDLNLWLQKNALDAHGNAHSGTYQYLFKNGTELQINNY